MRMSMFVFPAIPFLLHACLLYTAHFRTPCVCVLIPASCMLAVCDFLGCLFAGVSACLLFFCKAMFNCNLCACVSWLWMCMRREFPPWLNSFGPCSSRIMWWLVHGRLRGWKSSESSFELLDFYSMKWLGVMVRVRSTFHRVDIPANIVLQISR